MKELESFMIAETEASNLSFLSEAFRAQGYAPEALEIDKRLGPIDVSTVPGQAPVQTFETLDAFLALMQSSEPPDEARATLKTIGIRQIGTAFTTEVLAGTYQRTPRSRVDTHASWTLHWIREDDQILLEKIAIAPASVSRQTYSKAEPWMQDRTEEVLGSIPSYHAQLKLSSTYWIDRLDPTLGVDLTALHGMALGDANGDGTEDLYLCMQGGLPNRLLLQAPDGRITEASSDHGLDFNDLSRHALFVDFDNDGEQELAVHLHPNIVVLNRSDGVFRPSFSHRLQAMAYSLAAADYDNDGLVDLYITQREGGRTDSSKHSVLGNPIPYHDANNGAPNQLLRNLGQLRFRDVTAEVHLQANNQRFSYAASWEDFDQDGDQDLNVANDFGRNNLYRNDDGQFVDVAATLGVEDFSAGMSVAWGDANGDGLVDLYVGNMFSSAGHRIAQLTKFHGELDQAVRQEFFRHARGNALFVREGDAFIDRSLKANVTLGRWAWSSDFADLNNDGWEDLLVANGFVTNDSLDDL